MFYLCCSFTVTHRDGNHRSGPRTSRYGIRTRFSRSVNLRDWIFCGMGRNGSCGITWTHIFFFIFFILLEKNKKESEKKTILVTFLSENIRSSGDDDSSAGDDDSSSSDDDSSSSDDDSSSGGVLIWFFLFITHNYQLLYYNVIFLV